MSRKKRSWLSRRDKVELFEQIRREYEFGVGTIAGAVAGIGGACGGVLEPRHHS